MAQILLDGQKFEKFNFILFGKYDPIAREIINEIFANTYNLQNSEDSFQYIDRNCSGPLVVAVKSIDMLNHFLEFAYNRHMITAISFVLMKDMDIPVEYYRDTYTSKPISFTTFHMIKDGKFSNIFCTKVIKGIKPSFVFADKESVNILGNEDIRDANILISNTNYYDMVDELLSNRLIVGGKVFRISGIPYCLINSKDSTIDTGMRSAYTKMHVDQDISEELLRYDSSILDKYYFKFNKCIYCKKFDLCSGVPRSLVRSKRICEMEKKIG